MKKAITLVIISLCAFSTQAQLWVEKMNDPNTSFYDVQQEFNNYWANRPYEKGKGYKQYKRWEYFMEPRVYPTGNKTLASQAYEKFVEWQNLNATAHLSGGGTPVVMTTTWTPVGPMGAPSGGNAGRINFVRFNPSNASIVYVGAADGGLWISTNGGTSWTTNTDLLGVIGCSDIAIDPTTPATMYLATGDGDAGDCYSIGVLKSTDGGATWNTTGLTWTAGQGRTIRRLIINPNNPQILIAATNIGIYRTTNGGTSWTNASTGGYKDVEFNPANPNTVYACGTTYKRSFNGGQTWTTITTGVPTTANTDRMSVAVTANDTSYVYLLAGLSSNNGFQGVYRSTNGGTSFTTMSTSPNLFGWNSTGSDTGGQSWYDQGFAVSQTNKLEVIVGGVNVWRSTNGGTSWTIYGHWTGTGAPYIHADIHDIIFSPSGVIWIGSDGGVFKRNSSTWQDMSTGMNIAQIYRVGLSASNASLLITGHQDNGTNRYNGTWAEVMGGDGMDCFIDRTNNNVMYGEQYNGDLNRSTNGGTNWTSIVSGLTGSGAWMTPWHQDPAVANTIYVGYQQLFKSTNQGTAWAQVAGSMTGTSTIVEFAIAPSNNQVIYVIKGNTLYKTTNGGGAWTNITGTLPTASAQMTNLCVDPTDPTNAWVTFSGYSSANKVFTTTDGGTTWTNISTGLPNLPANTICYTPGSANDAIYVGMDVGVYYRDNTTGAWALYNVGLPNVTVDDLEIYSPTGKLRAATFGRGVWEVDLYNTGTMAPIANFSSNQQVICPGMTITFTDQSSFVPTSWAWSVSPSTGVTINTATSQNPTMTFANSGTYTVTLTATNANGTDSEIKNSYITVTGTQILPLQEGFVSATFPPTNWTTKDVNSDGIFWARHGTVGSQGTTSSMWFDNYTLDAAGAKDEMQAPKYDFSGLSSATLTFDVAYRQYDNTYSDTLAVLVSTDCGVTFTQMYMKGGSTLSSVVGTQTANVFTPSSAAQWRAETVSLNSFIGQTSVMVVFQNRGRWGQALYVDNINITGVGGVAPTANFTSSTTKCTGTAIAFSDASTGSPTSWAWSTTPSTGVTINTATSQNPTMTFTTAGTYTVSLTATNSFGNNSSNQTITVIATPTVTATSQTVCAGTSATITGSGATTYSWNTGATTTSIVVTPTVTTTYTVTGTTSGCTNTATSTVTVNALPNTTVTSQTVCAGTTATITASGASSYLWSTGGVVASIAVTPTVTTTYTVTGTAANGCTKPATSTVTVNAVPVVTANSQTVCAGNTATIAASGATTYSWSTGATTSTISVTPASTTTYTVTGTANTCTNTATATVTVNALPNVSATSQTVCAGTSATVTASGATTYSWDNGATTASITETPTSTTTYSVTGTGANGCANIATSTITVNALPVVTVSSETVCIGNSATLTANGANTYNWNTGATTNTVSVSPTVTTIYTVTGISINTCSATETATVTVVSQPTVTVNSETICTGATATLTATGASSYSWNTGATGATLLISPIATTSYTVTGSLGIGCSDTSISTVIVNPIPTVTAASDASGDSICSGEPVVLTGSGAGTYSWSGGVSDGVAFFPTSTQTYTVTGTDANNCSNTSVITIIVDACLGVNEIANSNAVIIYPNPVKEVLYIDLTSMEGTKVLEIFDVSGRMIEKINTAQSSLMVTVKHFSAGTYILKVQNEKGRNIQRFVIEK